MIACPVCKRPFITEAVLARHIYDAHPADVPEHLRLLVGCWCKGVRGASGCRICDPCWMRILTYYRKWGAAQACAVFRIKRATLNKRRKVQDRGADLR